MWKSVEVHVTRSVSASPTVAGVCPLLFPKFQKAVEAEKGVGGGRTAAVRAPCPADGGATGKPFCSAQMRGVSFLCGPCWPTGPRALPRPAWACVPRTTNRGAEGTQATRALVCRSPDFPGSHKQRGAQEQVHAGEAPSGRRLLRADGREPSSGRRLAGRVSHRPPLTSAPRARHATRCFQMFRVSRFIDSGPRSQKYYFLHPRDTSRRT